MLDRLRNDFQLTIITLFGALGAFGILPFALYRFATGNLLVGAVDSAIVVCILAAVLYAWRTNDCRRPGLFLVFINTAGTLTIAVMLGTTGLFWMYTTLLANFFLVPRRHAAAATALALLFLGVHGATFQETTLMLSFLITASMVSLFAFIFAARTESQRLQLEQLAARDPLTGVDNRRAMEQELRIAVETFRRARMPYGLVLLDLDHFKAINDRRGHEAGDRVLLAFALLIRASSRKVDRVFRLGGEEFVLLLPGTGTVGLQRICANLLEKIGQGLRGPDGPVTASLGAAALEADEDWPSWLARADAAMYRAKDAGRARAIIDRIDEGAEGEGGS